MQAGESLSFITVPEELAVPETFTDDERGYVLYKFYHGVKQMLSGSTDTVRFMERLEEFGVVMAKEASFQVPFNDGSYLYLVAYGHEYENDFLDLGLSITEHGDEGDYLGGFSFELTGADLRYAAHHAPTAPTDDSYEEDRKYHFSLLDQYEHKDELEMLAITGNDETREVAQQSLDSWKEEVDLALTSKDVGFSWREVSPDQIQLIAELMRLGIPVGAPRR